MSLLSYYAKTGFIFKCGRQDDVETINYLRKPLNTHSKYLNIVAEIGSSSLKTIFVRIPVYTVDSWLTKVGISLAIVPEKLRNLESEKIATLGRLFTKANHKYIDSFNPHATKMYINIKLYTCTSHKENNL